MFGSSLWFFCLTGQFNLLPVKHILMFVILVFPHHEGKLVIVVSCSNKWTLSHTAPWGLREDRERFAWCIGRAEQVSRCSTSAKQQSCKKSTCRSLKKLTSMKNLERLYMYMPYWLHQIIFYKNSRQWLLSQKNVVQISSTRLTSGGTHKGSPTSSPVDYSYIFNIFDNCSNGIDCPWWQFHFHPPDVLFILWLASCALLQA